MDDEKLVSVLSLVRGIDEEVGSLLDVTDSINLVSVRIDFEKELVIGARNYERTI